MQNIPEADWKAWRALSKEALNRFCERALNEAAELADTDGTPYERYLQMYKQLMKRDAQIADVFNDQRRSRAYQQIASAIRHRIITRAELSRFSEHTQAVIRLFVDGV